MKRKLLACALSISLITPTFAAIEIDETSYGPSYGSTLTDVAIGKPLQLAGAILGTAAYIAAIPFSLASDSLDETHRVLVEEPWYALQRCNGCTVSYDNYLKLKNDPQAELRFVVVQPSEVVINTNGEVVIKSP